uniref:UBP-type domain-containing protein n=1 Tax=Gadus morhua TaxID=8049 RepID=A0A8C5ANC5_GADMO
MPVCLCLSVCHNVCVCVCACACVPVCVCSHPECPDRVTAIMEELERRDLRPRCLAVEVISILMKDYVDLMRKTQTMSEKELQTISENYDSVYIHPDSFRVASLAVGSLLELVDKVMTSELRNGFSVSRPPGHHAQFDQSNGYCLFNNVAIATRYAQRQHRVKRVLVVDWDVHHGQGIQYAFEEDPSVLYFSVHRYEKAGFWPHLQASDGPVAGSGAGLGYTINLPWNKVCLSACLSACLSVFLSVCLHVCLSFQPQLVLVAAGFDCVRGDPKGEMEATPQCFSVLTRMLMGLAEGRVLLALEGGYNLRSTAEGAAACVSSLLGDPCPPLSSSSPSLSHHPEQPQRISKIFNKHLDLGLVDRCQRIPARLATEGELAMCHSEEHIEVMKATAALKSRDLHRLASEYNSVFLSQQSYSAALLAAGAAFNAAQGILTGQLCNAVAIVRPPGHHAERESACGFCLFNTAALTARYAQSLPGHAALRVLILDWDIHHGNGTQHMFQEDDSVLYISLHRYDNGTFFPTSEDADCDRVGVGQGAGFNVNIPWNGRPMGDSDYLAAFHHIVLPIATEFNPGLVVVSAGFDAARGDPLGGYHVTPEGYAHLTHLLSPLAGGKLLIILEGGYNLTSISDSMAMCTSVLLGDPPPPLATPLPAPRNSAMATINKVLRCHAPYWKALRITSTKSDTPSRTAEPPAGLEQNYKVPHNIKHMSCCVFVLLVVMSSPCFLSLFPNSDLHPQDSGLDQLTQGLASLDIHQATSANQMPVSPEVGGARRKVVPQKSLSQEEVKPSPQVVTAEDNQLAASKVEDSQSEAAVGVAGAEPEEEGACGWSKPPANLELISCGDGGGGSLYVVDPLPWCPHLDCVKPLPPSGIDVGRACLDCGSEAENWTCLTCYQVFCGRYVNEHMVFHGAATEHPVVLSFSDLSVWCYRCEAYLHNKVTPGSSNPP